MKIAIFLGGQKRFTKKGIDLFYENIIKPFRDSGIEVNCFCLYKPSTDGDLYTRPTIIQERGIRDIIIYSDDCDAYFIEKLTPLYYFTIDYKDPTCFPNIDLQHPHVSKKYAPNFYNISENLQKFLTYEKALDDVYDIFIKARIDINYTTKINVTDVLNICDNEVIIPHKEAHVYNIKEDCLYNDQTWICKREIGIKLLNMYNELIPDMVENLSANIEPIVLNYILKELKCCITKTQLDNSF